MMEEEQQDHVDSTLPPEWVLPELPQSHTPSLSTAEFEEIFGGSDEEENFPLSLGGLQGHMTLGDGAPKPNELLISSIEQSLALEPLRESSADDKVIIDTEEEHKMDVDIKNEVSCMDTTNEETIESNDNIIDESSNKVDSGVLVDDESMDHSNMNNEETPGVSRRSARIKAKEEDPLFGGISESKKEEEKDEVDEDEKSITHTLLEKDKEIYQSHEEGERNNGDNDSSDEDYGDDDSDDPDKLWCLCQQPHDDRFMICCDSCGEWYHGECVGISVTEGKRMEKTGQDYICAKCVDHEKEVKAERERHRSLRLAKREQIREKQLAEYREKRLSSLSEQQPSDEQDDLFQPDNLSDKEKTGLGKKKIRFKDVVKKSCIGPGCEKLAVRPCLYCSDECIERHCQFSLKKMSARGISTSSAITVYEPLTRKMLTGLSAPNEKALIPWIKEHKSWRVFVPSGKVLSTSKKQVKKTRKESDKDDQLPDSSTNRPTLDAEAMRGHARKALKQVLWSRCQSASDIDKSEDEVSHLADDIELKLYNLHNQDVNPKYRSKCRSLLFNLKDTKNQGLFKKLVLGELTSRQIVRMTPDQLASEELSEWREKTMKKELDMIKEVAIEAVQMSSSGTIRKMTYKGEVEIERPTEIDGPNDKADEVSSTTPEVPPGDVKTAIKPLTPVVRSDKEKLETNRLKDINIKESSNTVILPILTDTTSQHGSHVFDQNCDICLGKKPQEPSPKPIKSVDTSDSDVPSPDSRTVDSELMETEVTSPDPIHTSSSMSITPMTPLQPIWTGTLSMHGMEKFSAVAYPVSGQTDGIELHFPDELTIVGRIAHVQVWDYLDKLKSSLTKEILVLRFDRTDENKNAYLDLMDYFIHKHRYGVVQCYNFGRVKDMYLIPLPYDDDPPAQLLPFNGPGLPLNRRDTYLCVITRIKYQQPSTPDTPRQKKYRGRVQFRSSSTDISVPLPKRPHLQVEVGFDGSTPPPLSASIDENLSSPLEDVKTVPIKPMFYRDTDEIESVKTESEVKKSSQDIEKTSDISNSGIKSILSSLSDEKLKELASAMSTFNAPIEEQKNTLSNTTSGSEYYSTGVTKPISNQNNTKTGLSLDERLSATFGYRTDFQPFVSGPSGPHMLSNIDSTKSFESMDVHTHQHSNIDTHVYKNTGQNTSNYTSVAPVQNIYQQRRNPQQPTTTKQQQQTSQTQSQQQQPNTQSFYPQRSTDPRYHSQRAYEQSQYSSQYHSPTNQSSQQEGYPHQSSTYQQTNYPSRYHSGYDYQSSYDRRDVDSHYRHRGYDDRRIESRDYQHEHRSGGDNWRKDEYRGRDRYRWDDQRNDDDRR